MGVYAEKVVPHVINFACGMKVTRPHRARVCEDLTGEVIELGFGSGHNVPYYPDTVTRVTAIEPSDVGWRLSEQRRRQSHVPIARGGLDGQSLPYPDGSFDSALSTWTLCTIPDPHAALLELRRVLKPGGEFHFLEHGLAPAGDVRIRAWQHRLEPMQIHLFAGCHLTRPVQDMLRDAGFEILTVDVFYEKGAPKAMGADSLGIATAR
ncbi:class I SAM-dependent methyltransferase [Streptacidiphilus monticola]|uniref:Class I SAM-dependent methyltransferase n=1 Tax=Streptacidiphilus monticola TaxID=2161674 RepID=A0ABW1G5F8_9ACTN